MKDSNPARDWGGKSLVDGFIQVSLGCYRRKNSHLVCLQGRSGSKFSQRLTYVFFFGTTSNIWRLLSPSVKDSLAQQPTERVQFGSCAMEPHSVDSDNGRGNGRSLPIPFLMRYQSRFPPSSSLAIEHSNEHRILGSHSSIAMTATALATIE